MAQRRLFSLKIVDTDAFLDMPQSSQLLYFHLAMRADDEGFVGNPKKVMRMIGGNDDDLKVLLAKRFILSFQSGVVVIKHWLIHNTIRMDRFNPTTYKDEKDLLIIKENKAYTEIGQLNGNQSATSRQPKLSKVNLSKVNIYTAKQVGGTDVLNRIESLTDYFISLKGIVNPRRSRYFKTAKELLELADNNLPVAKEKLDKLKSWADSNNLEYEMETCIKRYLEL